MPVLQKGNGISNAEQLRVAKAERFIKAISWSPNGRSLAICYGKNIQVWQPEEDQSLLYGEVTSNSFPNDLTWSPDSNIVAAVYSDWFTILWDAKTGRVIEALKDHHTNVEAIAWSPDGKMIATGDREGNIQIRDTNSRQILKVLENKSRRRTGEVKHLSWSPQGETLSAIFSSGDLSFWSSTQDKLSTIETPLSSKSFYPNKLAWSPNSKSLYIASSDKAVHILDAQEQKFVGTIEGYTGVLNNISMSADGYWLATSDTEGITTIRRCDTWEVVSTSKLVDISSEEDRRKPEIIAFNPAHEYRNVLATLDTDLQTLSIWKLTRENAAPIEKPVFYTTAKIALVGDGTVGKSGLGHRIVEEKFIVTEATHGQQFWVVDSLSYQRADNTQCEAILWDFAGQANYRPIHTLFLDDVDLALVLFDPSRMNTFSGVEYWLRQLSFKKELCRTVLIASRIDVCAVPLTSAEINDFCQQHGISGGFIETSAKTGDGIDELMDRIRQQIDWNAKSTIVTTETFKCIKDFVLKVKQDSSTDRVLLSFEDLKQKLETAYPSRSFDDVQIVSAVEHLKNHGYVSVLRRSAETWYVLLVPDLIINLAARFMLRAQQNERGLGAIDEVKALRNEYKFEDVDNLESDERNTLLSAVTELLIERNVCFRESIDGQTFLIFPSLIMDRPPRIVEDSELIEDTTYIVRGLTENIFPALVVLVGYAPNYRRTNQWNKQAQYGTVRGEICGFKADDSIDGLELVLYFGNHTPSFVRSRFQGLFEEILYTRDVQVEKYDAVDCPNCHHRQERRTVIRRIKANQLFVFCEHCGGKVSLADVQDIFSNNVEERDTVAQESALTKMRTTYETVLVSVKGILRERDIQNQPTCFISYAWGDKTQQRWIADQFCRDLQNADIEVILDDFDNPSIGASVSRFISRIEKSDFILVMGTPNYRDKYENKVSKYGSVVAAEVDLINVRMMRTEEEKDTVLPTLLEGEDHSSLPPLMRGRVYGDFRKSEFYFDTLFNLILTLHRIPFKDKAVVDLRRKIRDEADELFENGQGGSPIS